MISANVNLPPDHLGQAEAFSELFSHEAFAADARFAVHIRHGQRGLDESESSGGVKPAGEVVPVAVRRDGHGSMLAAEGGDQARQPARYRKPFGDRVAMQRAPRVEAGDGVDRPGAVNERVMRRRGGDVEVLNVMAPVEISRDVTTDRLDREFPRADHGARSLQRSADQRFHACAVQVPVVLPDRDHAISVLLGELPFVVMRAAPRPRVAVPVDAVELKGQLLIQDKPVEMPLRSAGDVPRLAVEAEHLDIVAHLPLAVRRAGRASRETLFNAARLAEFAGEQIGRRAVRPRVEDKLPVVLADYGQHRFGGSLPLLGELRESELRGEFQQALFDDVDIEPSPVSFSAVFPLPTTATGGVASPQIRPRHGQVSPTVAVHLVGGVPVNVPLSSSGDHKPPESLPNAGVDTWVFGGNVLTPRAAARDILPSQEISRSVGCRTPAVAVTDSATRRGTGALHDEATETPPYQVAGFGLLDSDTAVRSAPTRNRFPLSECAGRNGGLIAAVTPASRGLRRVIGDAPQDGQLAKPLPDHLFDPNLFHFQFPKSSRCEASIQASQS